MRRCTNVVMVIGLLLVATGASWAFSLFDYVEAGTKIEMKFKNWDVGTLYDVDDDSDPVTPGVQPYVGEALLDTLTQTGPDGGAAGEDNWGIFKLAEIYVEGAASPFWTSETADEEISGIFWGERDTYLEQETVGTDITQLIHGVGMSIAFFSDLKVGGTAFDQTGGPLLRDAGGLPIYPTVTDGDLLWTVNTITGFSAVFPTDEYFAEFIPSASAGQTNSNGGFYADAGAVPYWGVGPGNVEIANYLPGIDMVFSFTGKPDPAGKWIVASNDPILTAVTPELSSSSLMLLGFIPMGLGWWRRRKA